MADSNSNSTGKGIWSQITLDQLIAVITTLGDRVHQLKNETWRWNGQTASSASLWSELIDKLGLNHDEKTRHAWYNIWRSKRLDIRSQFEKKNLTDSVEGNERVEGEVDEKEDTSITEKTSPLLPDPSLPLPSRPNTRGNDEKNVDKSSAKNEIVEEKSFAFSAIEWKSVFSSTTQTMKDECQQPDDNSSKLFLIRVYGEENHNPAIAIGARNLSGERRHSIGQRANEIGPLRVFRELINEADENLLSAGNYTQCPTIETIKKAAADYRQKMHIDESIFTECRILRLAYMRADPITACIRGYIHEMAEIPFRAHLFTETQIKRYISYCKKEKYSYVNIDATGGVLKRMCDQKQLLLYAVMFKDGVDAFDTVPLAHAILTKHTVASICTFLDNLAESITVVNKKPILPSFFIIDFSAALMNAILKTFNVENINNHLNRCWNVISGKYTAQEVRSLSFIHLCCCHVMHAIARSLTAARIDKKLRKAILHVFAIILCNNHINELFDILGMIINIFGDPNEQNAKQKLEELLLLQLNVDQESELMLKDGKKIFKKAKKMRDKLNEVDEYLRSNTPIIHQSPFNKEAIRRYPNLANLVNNKNKPNKIDNPLFSPSLIRIFYRWWAYLPLWTGLLLNFQERYSSDIKETSLVTYKPVRYSNAVIESYFRTFKRSIIKGKKSNRPLDIITELYGSVRAQCKADQFEIKQSAKGRKRRKKNVLVEEKWGKRKAEKKVRTVYFKMIDQSTSKRVRTNLSNSQSCDATENHNESDDTTTTISSKDTSKLCSDQSDDNSSENESSQSTGRCSISSSSNTHSRVSRENSIDIPMNLGNPTMNNDEESIDSIESNSDRNQFDSNINTSYPENDEPKAMTDQSSKKPHDQLTSHPEIMIDGCAIRWPKFQIKNALFEGNSYSLNLTCPLDTGLLVLYFIYQTDTDIEGEIDESPRSSQYSILAQTFKLANREGWDAARIYWLLNHNILKRTDRKEKSLFGAVDEQVFSFLREQQKYTGRITCSRSDCIKRVRQVSSTELMIGACDNHIEKFEKDTAGVCTAMAKRRDEMTVAEARKKNYKSGRIEIFNCETNRNEYVNAWLCYAENVHEAVTFYHCHPPIIIINIENVSRRSEEGYEDIPARLRDIKHIIQLGSVRYKLRAVIHNKSLHFTATLIGKDGKLFSYDDRRDIRENRMSTDPIEMGIYSQIYEF
ncbi:unnamed protein product [Rotaria magnacalcarata]|uniref:Uncharacterized protein n=1 Tax=Rotaria magnacalcarata TaxID=392030 RepID=A0A816ZA28_9BILA|nr:unnamed protein product [Rotaria magnacalcarata]CAF2186080.1 unnamed protein product [Rotaria magnacalcarata]CAF4163669.1 unnamed protein product [Rotaria magnacalcarata]